MSEDWYVAPLGRSYLEPQGLSPEQKKHFNEINCTTHFEEDELKEQRRVVIQIVPRMDKLLVTDWWEQR